MRMSASLASCMLATALLTATVVMPRAAASPPVIGVPTVEPDGISEIRDLRRQWVEAMNRDDVFTALETYGEGAVVLPEHAPPMLGTASIGSWLHRWNALVHVAYDVDARILDVDGRQAVEEWVARVTVTPRRDDRLAIGDDVIQFEQGGVRVYRRDAAGHWKIDRETWSPEPPSMARYSSCVARRSAAGTC